MIMSLPIRHRVNFQPQGCREQVRAFPNHGAWQDLRDPKLSVRLRKVLTDAPGKQFFSVKEIIATLEGHRGHPGSSHGASLALFSAADLFGANDVDAVASQVSMAVGASLATGQPSISVPRSILRRRIPRNSLAILIHGIANLMDSADGVMRQRWNWVFHPMMSKVLGLMIFLLGVASMAPFVGGGVQHGNKAGKSGR